MQVMKWIVGLTLVAPSFAFAGGGKPLPAAQHKPPIIVDEPTLSINLGNGPQGEGYVWNLYYEIAGVTSKTDRVRLDWKSGGKVVFTQKCSFDGEGGETAYATGHCENREKPQKAKGAIEADLIYIDDQTDQEYLVRTLKLNVVFLKGKWETWGIVPDDILAPAWIYHTGTDATSSGLYRRPRLFIAFAAGGTTFNARCTVDGTKKIADFEVGENTGGGLSTGIDHLPSKGDRVSYGWSKLVFVMDIYWGKRDTLKYDMGKTMEKDRVLSDNPGKWLCDLRKDGLVVRQLGFTVDKDGMVQQSEIQSGKNPIPTVSKNVVMIENRFTKDSGKFDNRINPAAMKASMGYGLPWPEHPKVKEIQATYPAKSGLPDPK